MHTVIIEDSARDAQEILRLLKQDYPQAKLTVIRDADSLSMLLPSLVDAPPDLFITDIMLGVYQDPAEPKAYRAGFGCLKQIQEHMTIRDVPVIVYSALPFHEIEADIAGLPINCAFLSKTDDNGQALPRLIRSMLALRGIEPTSTPSNIARVFEYLGDDVDLFGFTIRLRKLIDELRQRQRGRRESEQTPGEYPSKAADGLTGNAQE